MAGDTMQQLGELQAIDTALDRLEHRRRTAPEHQRLEEATTSLRQAARWRAATAARLAEIDDGIAASEDESSGLSGTRDRLQAQLRTVIAPREAEALMHEIDTVNARRGALDDAELAALEEQEQLTAELDADEAQEPARRAAVAQAQAALDQLLADVDAQVAAARTERNQRAEGFSSVLLARYERLRANLDGVAVAHLEGRQCTGCHLELSAGELDALRLAGPDDVAECPQCSRLLVR